MNVFNALFVKDCFTITIFTFDKVALNLYSYFGASLFNGVLLLFLKLKMIRTYNQGIYIHIKTCIYIERE